MLQIQDFRYLFYHAGVYASDKHNNGWGQIEDALLDYVFEQDSWN